MAKRLHLSSTNKKIAGVCGGIAEYFDVDPLLIRVLWIVGTLMGGAGILAYLIAWFILPKDDNI
ncbi:MAG: PspC domain-containing protein [Spirochaetes bacterium]|nr:PspC domain-containing protein [Spirochaetota bacterium]